VNCRIKIKTHRKYSICDAM